MKSKKEMNKNIIKLSKIFVLFCFSFLNFFFFSNNVYADVSGLAQGDMVDGFAYSNGSTGRLCEQLTQTGTYNVFVFNTDTGARVHNNNSTMPMTVNCTNADVDIRAGTPTGYRADVFGTNFTTGNWTFKWGVGSGSLSSGDVANLADTGEHGTYFQYYGTIVNGEVTPIPSGNTGTRITLLSPENNATTTTSVEIEIEYFINSETHPDLDELYIDIDIINGVLVSGTSGYILDLSDDIVYDELVATSTTITLPTNQVYTWNAKLRTKVTSETCNNPLLSIVFCAFEQATQKSIAVSQTWKFVIGNNPLDSIENFGESLFSAVGQDANLLGGGCAFVATSTCDIGSPSTYGGCFTNSLIVVLCPSANTINYATTTLMNSLYNKMPFGFFVQPYIKINDLVNATSTVAGTNVVVDIPSFGVASTTIFSWTEAKNFMDNVIGEEVINILMIIELVGLTFYVFYRLIGRGKQEDV